MKKFFFLIFFLVQFSLFGQKKQFASITITSNASAYPFGILAGYFKNPVHPGFELGWEKVFKEKKKHTWYGEAKLGYFYHRFLQHGIPLYVNYGYKYKFNTKLYAGAAIGAGSFHSVPATAVLKLEEGEYKNAKGIGRPQAIAAFTLSSGYTVAAKSKMPVTVFLHYQARVQMPFVKSYVPVLPYNQIGVGASINLLTFKK
ncbi:MAG: hypothetical protein QM725_04750 [Lacibacter sp.]